MIKLLNMIAQEWEDDRMYHTASLILTPYGVENVCLHMYTAVTEDCKNCLRLHVSDKFNSPSMDGFYIDYHTLEYEKDKVPEWMTEETLSKIFKWIKLNKHPLDQLDTITEELGILDWRRVSGTAVSI